MINMFLSMNSTIGQSSLIEVIHYKDDPLVMGS